MTEDVQFYTQGGLKLAARLTLPEDTPAPAVLLLPALLAGDTALLALAERLAERGFASLALDFRGCGASEGEKGWLDPQMRLEDAHNAFAWMLQCPSLDPARLGVWGHRFSSPVAIGLAAQESRVKALVGSSGPGSGLDFMRSLRTGSEWLETLDRVREDRRRRALTGESEMVPIDEIVPMKGFLSKLKAGAPTFKLANIDAIMRFHTEDYAARLGNRPLLLVVGERDEVIAVADVEKVWLASPGPKRLAVLAGFDHAGMETGDGLDQQLSLAIGWFEEHL